MPYFEFPFLDTYTLRSIGRERFVELCREAAVEVGGEPFLAVFGHRWKFQGEGHLAMALCIRR